MAIKIYNSLTRKKEEFVPLKEGCVGMYVCGPTVYDEPHIGHLRSAYIFDVVRRYLIYKGYKVTFVRNVTDVDDKIINKAREEYPNEKIEEAVEKVSLKYLEYYHKAVEEFGIMPPDKEPKATEYIKKMQKLIGLLIDKGIAYQSGGDVYFDIKKAKNYGKLSNQSLEMMEAGARVSPDEKKRDPLDFALWKAAKEGEPSWESPWGKGRPGWHIECSVMSSDVLGDEFDIHGGGLDLIFPHHENEVAQSEAAGKKFAKYWVHHGLLTINGQKMSKSLGNFITIKDFMTTYKDMDYLKLFFLSAHYSHPIDYTEEKIEEAKKRYERLSIMLEKVTIIFRNINSGELERLEREVKTDSLNMKINFEKAMDDNFNMPQALAVIDGLITWNNTIIDYGLHMKHKESVEQLYYNCRVLLPDIMDIFGLSVTTGFIEDLTTEEKQLIDDYQKARSEKDYKISDEKRTQLNKLGIIIEETKDGTTWRPLSFPRKRESIK